MRQVSTILILSLAALICFSTISYAASLAWPLKGPIDFASGFGDFRQDRFHAGFDIRTGGVTGRPVYSPVSGYVSRIKMSYYGYGKGLYVTGSDGRIYVYGHLSRFSPRLDSLIQKRQFEDKRYYVDVEYRKDSVPVQAGELIAYSGQTGAGAPHLHFEVRTPDNRPLNPLLEGFSIKDGVRPRFNRLGFQMMDDRSLFSNGGRRIFFPIRSKSKKQFVLDTVLYFNRPFGLLADCFDQHRADGMKEAVHRLSLYVDDTLAYDVVMDTLEFESGTAADLVYDYSEVAGGHCGVRRLFDLPGDQFPGIRSRGADGGLIRERTGFSVGLHRGRILAQDVAGNSAELQFRFVWGPSDRIFSADSTSRPTDSTTIFYFSPSRDYARLGIDTVVVYLNRASSWGITPSAEIRRSLDGQLAVTIHGHSVDEAVLRLAGWTKDKCTITEPIFNGMYEWNRKRAKLSYELDNDGLFVSASVQTSRAFQARLDLYYRDSLIGVEPLRNFFTLESYRWLIPPIPKYARIDRINLVREGDSLNTVMGSLDSLNIALVGVSDTTVLSADTSFSALFPKTALNEPRFVSLARRVILNKVPLHLQSEDYQIEPEQFVLRTPFKVIARPYREDIDSFPTPMYRLDTLKNRWVWVTDSTTRSGSVYASSRLGGSFAAVIDLDPPTLSGLNVADRQTLNDPRPVFSLKVIDTGSGIGDDRCFTIKIDSQWEIPEYDPETGLCRFQPFTPLQPGSHYLLIEIRDRAGNEGHQYLHFAYRPAATPKKGK